MPRGRKPKLQTAIKAGDALVVDDPHFEEEVVAPAAPRAAAHQSRGAVERPAAHMEDHETPRIRTRSRKATVAEDPFYINREEIPEGLDYEWKRWSVGGVHDPFYIAQQRQQGWEPVPPKRHPNWVPPGYKEPHIVKGGQILMDRPMELTNDAKRELRDLSKQQVREAEQRLGMTAKGELTRDFDGARPRITKEIGRMVAVEE